MKRSAFFAAVFSGIAALAGFGLAATPVAAQQTPSTEKLGTTTSAAPCCGITSINAKSGQVIARVTATGQTFTFTASPSVLSSMKVGQSVYANFTSKQVSVNGEAPCCAITAVTALPCCAITAINAKNGQVSARVTATGQTFTFTASPSVLSSMKTGQGIYANFTSQQVSVNGAQPCCGITAVSPAPSSTASANDSNSQGKKATKTKKD